MNLRWIYIALTLAVIFVAASASAEDAIQSTAERGPVVAILRIEPGEPVIGDVVTLELEVRAAAKVELPMPEFGEALGRFEIIDFAPREEVDEHPPASATLQPQRV